MAEMGHSYLPEEIRALIALAPSDVKITKTEMLNWKIEALISYTGKDGRLRSGTSTRWMCPFQHSLEEWAAAIEQVRNYRRE